MTPEPVDRQPSRAGRLALSVPDPLPVTWRLSRWQRAKDGFPYAVGFGFAGLFLQDVGDQFFGLTTIVCFGMAGLIFLTTIWLVLFPGHVRLDEDGITWRRRRVDWVRVAPFRVNRAGHSAAASSYVLPTTPEQERLQQTGAISPEEVDVPAWAAGMSPWRVVALLNHYREEAVERSRASTTDVAGAVDA